MLFISGARSKPVDTLKKQALRGIQALVQIEAEKQSSLCYQNSFGCNGYTKCLEEEGLTKYIEDLQVLIFSQVLWADVDAVTKEILSGLEEAMLTSLSKCRKNSLSDIGKFVNSEITDHNFTIISLIVRFAEVICHEKLRNLNFENIHHLMRTNILRHLSRLSGIQTLTLIYETGEPEKMDKYYSSAFSNLKNLQCLIFKKSCTDNIIHILAKNCFATLKKLDVEGSAWVTNESIPSLVNMRLRELNTSKCSISVSGVAAILQNMKNLTILDVGIPFVDVLEYQDEISQTCLELHKKLKIEDFQPSRTRPYYTKEEIELVADYCPNIRKLCFKYNPKFLTDFAELAVFENLSMLEIWGGEYYSSNLFFLLETIGQNLTCLHLCHVEQLSCQSVLHLASHCSALREIKLENCVFKSDQTDNDEVDNVPYLLNLKVLSILNSIPQEIFMLLVTKALNLKTIILDTFVDVTEKAIWQILEHNKLEKLEDFVVYSSKVLRIELVFLLIENCPRFKKVRFIENWEANTEDEINNFWRYIETNNIDLDAGEKESYERAKQRAEGVEKLERIKHFKL